MKKTNLLLFLAVVTGLAYLCGGSVWLMFFYYSQPLVGWCLLIAEALLVGLGIYLGGNHE